MAKQLLASCGLCILLLTCNSFPNNKHNSNTSKSESESNNLSAIYSVDNSDVPEIADISNIVANVRIIPLIETAGNNIRYVFKIFAIKKHYVIFDLPSRSIQLFNKDGSFFQTITKPGRGPDEALEVADCWASETGELEYYDFPLRKIFMLDSAFRIKRKVKGSDSLIIYSFNKIPDSEYYAGYTGYYNNPSVNDSCYQFAFLDSNLNIVRTALHYNCRFKGVQVLGLRNHFFRYSDSLRFLKAYDNTVYNISDTLVEPVFRIKYILNEIPHGFLNQVLSKNLDYYKQQLSGPEAMGQSEPFAKYSYIIGWLENNEWLQISSNDSHSTHFSIIDKSTRKAIYTAKRFSETQKYNVVFPRFESYDPYDDTFLACEYGTKILSDNLLYESDFLDKKNIDPFGLYLFIVKFKGRK